jgi:hypothetical protein
VQWVALASLLCAADAQEAFGADVTAAWLDFGSLMNGLTRDQRVGVFLTITIGLSTGFILGRLQRYDWSIRKAWAGRPKALKEKRKRPGIETVENDEKVDPATIRGTPEYQRKIRGKAITLLVVLISTYYLHNFVNEKCGACPPVEAAIVRDGHLFNISPSFCCAMSAASGKKRKR